MICSCKPEPPHAKTMWFACVCSTFQSSLYTSSDFNNPEAHQQPRFVVHQVGTCLAVFVPQLIYSTCKAALAASTAYIVDVLSLVAPSQFTNCMHTGIQNQISHMLVSCTVPAVSAHTAHMLVVASHFCQVEMFLQTYTL